MVFFIVGLVWSHRRSSRWGRFLFFGGGWRGREGKFFFWVGGRRENFALGRARSADAKPSVTNSKFRTKCRHAILVNIPIDYLVWILATGCNTVAFPLPHLFPRYIQRIAAAAAAADLVGGLLRGETTHRPHPARRTRQREASWPQLALRGLGGGVWVAREQGVFSHVPEKVSPVVSHAHARTTRTVYYTVPQKMWTPQHG